MNRLSEFFQSFCFLGLIYWKFAIQVFSRNRNRNVTREICGTQTRRSSKEVIRKEFHWGLFLVLGVRVSQQKPTLSFYNFFNSLDHTESFSLVWFSQMTVGTWLHFPSTTASCHWTKAPLKAEVCLFLQFSNWKTLQAFTALVIAVALSECLIVRVSLIVKIKICCNFKFFGAGFLPSYESSFFLWHLKYSFINHRCSRYTFFSLYDDQF